MRWVLRDVLCYAPVFAALAANGAFVIARLPMALSGHSIQSVDAFGRFRFECRDDRPQRTLSRPTWPSSDIVQCTCRVDPLGRRCRCWKRLRCEDQDRMQMVRHDLRLIQPCMLEMVRDRTPAFINDTASIVQFQQRVRSITHDAPEQFQAWFGAKCHEVCALCVIAIAKARVLVEDRRHCEDGGVVDPVGRRYRCLIKIRVPSISQ